MKRVVAGLCLCLLVTAVFAQEKKVFFGGAYAGIATSQLSGDELAGYKKAGIYAGAFVNFHVSPKSILQLELSFIQKGSRSVSKTMGLIYHCNLQYLEMPLFYKYQLHKRFGLYAGPALGYLVKRNNVERDYMGTLPNRRPFNAIDLSAMAGVSIGILEHLHCDIRFSQSVIPVRAHESGAVYRLNRGQYNSVLSMILVVEY